MPSPKDFLESLPGGRVLDIATGSGGFIHFLLDGLKAYTEIIGVDASERGAAAFAGAFQDHPNIHFQVGDALHLDFAEASFDLVSIANSLHHFGKCTDLEFLPGSGPQVVLAEALRVLRPGGTLLVAEMYRDNQTETQMTHVLLHHWWAAVDRTEGIVHNETYQRAEIVGMVSALGLSGQKFYDLSSTDSDPKDPAILAQLEPIFDRYIQRAAGYPDLQARGEELRRRVKEVGFHSATTLLAMGQKP